MVLGLAFILLWPLDTDCIFGWSGPALQNNSFVHNLIMQLGHFQIKILRDMDKLEGCPLFWKSIESLHSQIFQANEPNSF